MAWLAGAPCSVVVLSVEFLGVEFRGHPLFEWPAQRYPKGDFISPPHFGRRPPFRADGVHRTSGSKPAQPARAGHWSAPAKDPLNGRSLSDTIALDQPQPVRIAQQGLQQRQEGTSSSRQASQAGALAAQGGGASYRGIRHRAITPHHRRERPITSTGAWALAWRNSCCRPKRKASGASGGGHRGPDRACRF